jgi:nucleotide-binding universal stress UspA family protein
MFTKLLIPLDGSRTAEKALPYARYLAQHKNITETVLRHSENPVLVIRAIET